MDSGRSFGVGRAAVAAALVVVLLVGAGGAFAADTASAQANESDWSPPGPFGIEELRTGGTQLSASGGAEAPVSARSLGTGGILVRHTPLSLINSEQQRLEPGATVNANALSLKTNAYVDATGEYELVLVYWTPESTTVNGTQRTYADEQTVQRVEFSASSGYDSSTIRLQEHFDETVQVTAWLEKGGERVDGARWRFKHRSNPLAASPAFAVNSDADLWRWAGVTILLPALLSLLVAGKAAKHVLDRTIIGAQKGVAFWGVSAGVVAIVAAGFTTFATASVLSNAPFVVGLTVGLIGFIVALGVNDAEAQKAGFFQRRIDDDAITPAGESTASSRVVPNTIKSIVERGSTIYMPSTGLRPMFARYWASPASAPKSELNTVDEGDDGSDLAKMYEVDPAAGEVLSHTAAHLSFAPKLLVDVEEEDLTEPPEGSGIASLPAAISSELSNWGKRVNWKFLAIAVGGGALLYVSCMAIFASQLVAAAVAAVPAVLAGTKARDGRLSIEPAPYHYNDVRANVASERREYVERKTFEGLHKEIMNMDFESVERAQKLTQKLRAEMSDRMEDMFGVESVDPSGDGDGEDGDDGDAPPWATGGDTTEASAD